MQLPLYTLMLASGLAAFAQGFCGFGYGILVMALLSLLTPEMERASVFVTLSIVVLLVTLLIRSSSERRTDWKQAAMIAPGILAAAPIGYWFILTHDRMPALSIVFGFVLIAFALNGLLRPHIRRRIHGAFAPLFGVFSGLLSGAFASGGPPLVLYLYAQEEDPRMAVGTLQAVFLGAALYRMAVVMAGSRGISSALLLQATAVSPVVVLGTLAGYRAARRVSKRAFLAAVYALIILAGVTNIAKGIAGNLGATSADTANRVGAVADTG